jgi:hypothetical protein
MVDKENIEEYFVGNSGFKLEFYGPEGWKNSNLALPY